MIDGNDGIQWTFITVTYNSANDLQKYWIDERPNFVEWIVVDNASTDNCAAIAQSLGAQVSVLEENRGFAAANNYGLTKARGKYVAFVNPDIAVDYSSIGDLEDAIARTQGIVAPQLRNPDGSLQPNGRGIPTLAAKINHRLPGGPRFKSEYLIVAGERDLIDVAWCMGAALCARTETFHRIGAWNDRYFVYYEDHELGLRAWEQGVPVSVLGAVTWVHGWARETKSVRLRPWINEIRSALTFFSSYPALLGSGARIRQAHPAAANAGRHRIEGHA